MKKIQMVILSVIFIALVWLTACSENITDNDSIDLSQYTIVCPMNIMHSSYNDYVESFRDILYDKWGITLDIVLDSKTENDADAKEILIGRTNRSESQAAYENLTDKNNYEILVSENKIVLIGKIMAVV